MSINLENIIKKKSLLLAFKAFFQKVEIDIYFILEKFTEHVEIRSLVKNDANMNFHSLRLLCFSPTYTYSFGIVQKNPTFSESKITKCGVNGFLEYIEHRLEEVLQRLRRFLRSRNIELQLHLYITEMLFFHCLFDRVNCREFLSGFKSSSIYFRTLLHKINYSTFAVKNL